MDQIENIPAILDNANVDRVHWSIYAVLGGDEF